MARESLRVAILQATSRLDEAGVASPRVDAEELAAHLLGISRTRLGLQPLVESEFVQAYQELIGRRAARIPLQHILGTAVLGPAMVQVGPGVFIPRPETESLVAWALAAIAAVPRPVVVDLCAGSGAIALAIALTRPDATVYAVEKESGALAWARRNAELHADAGGTPIRLLGGDFTVEALLIDLYGTVDLVTANPPYVPEATEVDPEVALYDPASAVFGGPDGLSVIRPLVAVSAALLRIDGVLAVEHDDTQGESAPALFAARGVLADVQDHLDLTGRPRFVTARRVPLAAH